MGTALQVLRSIAGCVLIVFGLVVFGQDSAARASEGKRWKPKWIAFVAFKNETPAGASGRAWPLCCSASCCCRSDGVERGFPPVVKGTAPPCGEAASRRTPCPRVRPHGRVAANLGRTLRRAETGCERRVWTAKCACSPKRARPARAPPAHRPRASAPRNRPAKPCPGPQPAAPPSRPRRLQAPELGSRKVPPDEGQLTRRGVLPPGRVVTTPPELRRHAHPRREGRNQGSSPWQQGI